MSTETTVQFRRLIDVFDLAYEQAAHGKGLERHGFDLNNNLAQSRSFTCESSKVSS